MYPQCLVNWYALSRPNFFVARRDIYKSDIRASESNPYLPAVRPVASNRVKSTRLKVHSAVPATKRNAGGGFNVDTRNAASGVSRRDARNPIRENN